MEITQFTYFQQVGGQNLDPVSVELTYGMERIMMALQGKTHFKDMVYAPGLSYGEVFGQSEYEMSRYYLDDADVQTNRELFERYTAEARRLIDARLPVPAHTYILKSSHAFNVQDSRGAISTTERATAFGVMRRLAREVSRLWVERREELGFPLLGTPPAPALGHAVMPPATGEQGYAAVPGDPGGAAPRLLAIEIGFEELPPHVVDQAIEQVRAGLADGLGASRLEHGEVSVVGTPRRIIALVPAVDAHEPEAVVLRKGPKVTAAYDPDGTPTKAAEGFARGQQVDVSTLVRAEFAGAEHVAVEVPQTGRDVFEVVGSLVAQVISGLRADKNMRWCDPALSYSRPIRWVVALWGEAIIPVAVSQLRSGRTTYAERTDESPLVEIENADVLVPKLTERGIVLDPVTRRESVVAQARSLAESVGGHVDAGAEAALVDEITNLVEAPHGIIGSFEQRYLELPDQVLTTVMGKHQRYLPVRDTQGALMPYFVTMAGSACDEDLVRRGNENVLRARYEDAAFFYEADLTVPLADLRAGIARLTFEDRVGSMAKRADRIRDIASALGSGLEGESALDADEAATLARAGELAKFDLASQMVVELPSMAGTMAREYAIRAGETQPVADALYEMELPRSGGDVLPTSRPGALLALADRFDLLMSMFALGAEPTGSSDPFALRRAALGVIAILRMQPSLAGISVRRGLEVAADRLRLQGVEVPVESLDSAVEFVTGRFGQQLHDEGVPSALAAAVAPLAGSPGKADAALADLEKVRARDGFDRLVEATQRITRLVPPGSPAAYDPAVLREDAERALHDTVDTLPDLSEATLPEWAGVADQLVPGLGRFFDEVLVMSEEPELRAARLGLLQTVIARAPRGLDWRALHSALASPG
ncbi:MAG: glycine--tRNA ligase subunit beta, partial [Micrococcales bacterium]|nr:glycine--tRNA ligase subunit beta [Micrococcales bacterium]